MRADIIGPNWVYEGGPHRVRPHINAILLQRKSSFSCYLTVTRYEANLTAWATSNLRSFSWTATRATSMRVEYGAWLVANDDILECHGAWLMANRLDRVDLGTALESPPVRVVGPHTTPISNKPPPVRSG
jgi:hypothetical protein